MSATRSSKICRLSYVILLLIVILVLTVVLFHRRLKSHVSDLCRYKSAELVNRMISETISEIGVTDTQLYRINYDGTGKIVSAAANDQALNYLQNRLRSELNERLSENTYGDVSLTLGDLTDIGLLNGKGAELSFGYQFSGEAVTEFFTSFEPSGINQTRFRASVIIKAEIKVFVEGKAEEVTVEQEYIAADALIVGEVPDFCSINRISS